MTPSREMDTEQRSALEKIRKLLQLAGRSPEEAATYTAKAQELLLAYNLDAAMVGSGDSGVRAKEKLAGGFYEYERDLLSRIADINFCLYWYDREWVARPEGEQSYARIARMRGRHRRFKKVWVQHVVGREISVMATRQMYTYLYDTIERLTREHISGGLPRSADDRVVGLAQALRSRRATSFREGIADTIAGKLWDRRQDQLAEERRTAAAEEMRAKQAAAAGASASTAVTISSVRESERDANMDFLYGEGWSARSRAAAAERARKLREAEEAYTQWAAEHPEEAAAEEKKRREEERKAERRRARRRWSAPREREKDWGAWEAGRLAGEAVGLDPQAENSGMRRRIGRG